MALLDRIRDAVEKVVPARQSRSAIPAPISTSASGRIGAGRGVASFEEDMIVSKPAIIFHASQIFFNFLALCCFASVASFQAHWGVGPSGLSGFAIFITIAGILLSLFMLLVPVIYEKYDKLNRLARLLKEVRIGFILAGSGTAVSLLISFIVTISAWTEPGCKDPNNDPHAKEKGDDFKNGLSGWCSTKKAGAIFLWLAFGFWLATLGFMIWDWRSGKSTRPRDPPFTAPVVHHEDGEDGEGEGEDDEESTYEHVAPLRQADPSNAAGSPFSDAHAGVGGGRAYGGTPAAYAAPAPPRASMDAYGAFSDPPPSGFGAAAGGGASPAGISRTMQYADPYAAVRASIAGASSHGSPAPSGPPSYEYTGYR